MRTLDLPATTVLPQPRIGKFPRRRGLLAPRPEGTSGLRILLVEDELTMGMALEMILQDAGLVCVGPVGRMHNALTMARDEPLDAALLDVNIGGERIFPVADLLAERRIPFLFFTGYTQETFPTEYRSHPTLDKLCDMQTLVATIVKAIQDQAA